MECKVNKIKHFRHPFLFTFNQSSKDTKTARDICAVVWRKVLFHKELYRNGFHASKRGTMTLQTACVLTNLFSSVQLGLIE